MDANATMKKFGFPQTVLEEGDRWVLQLRPGQVTLGSMVLICREPATSFAEISEQAYLELRKFVGRVEGVLKKAFRYEKINYLMLMMVDRDVHFHIIPRYSEERSFGGVVFRDIGWPGPPDLARPNETEAGGIEKIRRYLLEFFD